MTKVIPRVIPQSLSGCNPMTDLFACDSVPSFTEWLYTRLFKDVEKERLKQIEGRLAEMGHRFGSEYMLKEFLKENATIVTYTIKPDYREMYIFFGTKDQATVGAWWDTYRFENDFNNREHGYKMTVISGEAP